MTRSIVVALGKSPTHSPSLPDKRGPFSRGSCTIDGEMAKAKSLPRLSPLSPTVVVSFTGSNGEATSERASGADCGPALQFISSLGACVTCGSKHPCPQERAAVCGRMEWRVSSDHLAMRSSRGSQGRDWQHHDKAHHRTTFRVHRPGTRRHSPLPQLHIQRLGLHIG